MILIGINPNNLSPNTTYHYKSGNGSDMYIWSDGTGKATHSRHYTNHGYPNHPSPHDHDWHDKDDGSGNREQGHDPLPPNDEYSEDDAVEYDLMFESRGVYVPQFDRQENWKYLLVLELLLFAVGAPIPVPVI